MNSRRQVIAVWSVYLATGLASGLSISKAETRTTVDYLRDIKPLLAKKCVSCHGALGQEAGLRLDAGSFILAGGDDGPVVAPGNAATSRLIKRVSSDDVHYRMPPDGEGEVLEGEQISLLSAWIDAGALVPDDEPIPANPRDHWAFKKLVRPPLPDVSEEVTINPIDAFIRAEQQRAGVEPVATAANLTLQRRLFFDLIGLPPTVEQQQDFLRTESSQAWGELVDTLLASPHYGERWARHWMDVWRYSDWDGYKQELRSSQRHIWRWRDWIVRSLNADKGYDRMILEMLAADELSPGDLDALPATGFLARNFHRSNRNIWLDATVEHTAKAFLGITLNCARCHDHKYDPIPQQAYYQFRAIFEPHNIRMVRLPSEPDVAKDGIPVAVDVDPSVETHIYLRGNEKQPDKENPVSPAVPDVLGGSLDVQPVTLPIESYYPALQRFVMEQQLAEAAEQLATAQRALADATAKVALAVPHERDGTGPPADITLLRYQRDATRAKVRSLESRQAADRAKYLVDGESADESAVELLSMEAAKAERSYHVADKSLAAYEKQRELAAANASDDADEAKKQKRVSTAKSKLEEANKQLDDAIEAAKSQDCKYTPIGTLYPNISTGRRLALARWIASPDNPLTARVAVNHVWLRHFGTPLVDNVDDFGLRSARPRHAGLLDWLALELIDSGWSLKHLHRLILTSNTWRLSSSGAEASASTGDPVQLSRQRDPDNHTFWRMNVRRLEAEIVRDNVLAVAAELDSELGGPEIPFTAGEATTRRSLYLQHAYEKQMTMLVQFDAASPLECYRRSSSIMPQQALALANSGLSSEMSRSLSRRLWEEIAGDKASEDVASDSKPMRQRFIDRAFRQILTRPPTGAERKVCAEFLERQSALLAEPNQLHTFKSDAETKTPPATDPTQRARENFVLYY